MNKLYHLTDHLKTHTLTHRGVNDYECITCYKRLFHNVDLKTHRVSNTEVKNNNALRVRREYLILMT